MIRGRDDYTVRVMGPRGGERLEQFDQAPTRLYEDLAVKRLFAILLAVWIAASPSAANAAHVHLYAGQAATTWWPGIDGYIRGSGTVMLNPNTNFHAHFVNLCSGGNCGQWVQIGQYQGSISVITSAQFVHGYWENVDKCGIYRIQDLGRPPTPNYPYYVNFVGMVATSPECSAQAKYSFRQGSWTNPPVGTGYMANNSGIPIAETEITSDGAREPINANHFGANHSKQYQAGYALHIYNGANWLLWNDANIAGTSTFAQAPPLRTTLNQWAAFYTWD